MRAILAGLLLWLCCLPAIAQTPLPTTLDSDAVMLGDVVELRIDAGSEGAALDTAPLLADFSVRSHRQQRMSELRNGRFVSRVQHVLVLSPRRAGNLVVPALAVGDVHSKPLRLQVQQPDGQGDAGSAGTAPDPAIDRTWFVQAGLAAPAAYVGQPLDLLVSVYLGQDIASGELIVDAPPGASLQRVGQDQSSRVMHNGQPYLKVERRYQLTPERSGTISLPPARFIGRQLGGLWAGHGAQVQAEGPALNLQVRPVPANADTPWLPLQAARLQWLAVPDRLVAGQGARFEVQAELEGGTAAQRDVLSLPGAGPGWRLYPEPVVMEQRQQGARSLVQLRRSFLLVPEQAGSIELPAIQLPWWNAETGQRQVAMLPAQRLVVSGAANGAAADPAADAGQGDDDAADRAPPMNGAPDTVTPAGKRTLWTALSLLLVMLAAASLWGYRRRGSKPAGPPSPSGVTQTDVRITAQPSARLDQALAQGSVQEVIDALCALGDIADPARLPDALADAGQRQALHDAERAWWVPGGDRVAARKVLQQAFAAGPRWTQPAAAAPVDSLPPLYPPPRP